METEVIMKRELFGGEISQRSKSEFFSATDLVKAGNKWRIINGQELFRLHSWLENKSTKEFIAELEKHYGVVKISAGGKNQHTWVHPFLFIDIALAISPSLKIQVYTWLMDALLKYRNDSGDTYKMLAGAVYVASPNKIFFQKTIKRIAHRIQLECDVVDWQRATEAQLMLRDQIHRNIALLTEVTRLDTAVDVGIARAKMEIAEKKQNHNKEVSCKT